MQINRSNHTATLLNDGRVLIAGGYTDSGPATATAEVYDPTHGTFQLVESMSTPRAEHSAILLKSGRVLVAGDEDPSLQSVLSSAEIFDPTTNSFKVTGSMTTARIDMTATLLADGRVLVTGGLGTTANAAPISSTEIYDPTSQTFSPAANMIAARSSHGATALPSDKVLVVGELSPTIFAATSSAEVYDPNANTFTAVGLMTDSRSYVPPPVNLSNGEVVVIWGFRSFRRT